MSITQYLISKLKPYKFTTALVVILALVGVFTPWPINAAAWTVLGFAGSFGILYFAFEEWLP